MAREYYFCKEITQNTWKDFSIKYHTNQLVGNYEKIDNYGYDATFVLNPDGQALYISENDEMYIGVWFELNDRKVGVFARKTA